MASVMRTRSNREIEHLLYIHKTMRVLVQAAEVLVNGKRFPDSALAVAALAKNFGRELETALLEAYEKAPPPHGETTEPRAA